MFWEMMQKIIIKNELKIFLKATGIVVKRGI